MDNKYTAIIVEPRKHPALEFVLNNFLENLNNDWNIIIYHGKKNKIYIKKIINTKLQQYISRTLAFLSVTTSLPKSAHE